MHDGRGGPRRADPRTAPTHRSMLLQLPQNMLVVPVWNLVTLVVAAVVVAQLVCFLVALYEMMNLPEMRRVALGPRALAGVFPNLVLETLGTVVAVLTLPLGAVPWRRVAGAATSPRPPLVFVPGYAMTRACLWPLRHRLAAAGWANAVGYNYRTLRGDLEIAARGLRAAIADVATACGTSHVVVIAHGMGGLVARLCLRDWIDAPVCALVTLGTPHRGSKLYALALDPMAREMRPESAVLDALADDELPRRLDVTAIYSSFDVTVVPSSGGQYPGASNIEIEGVGHVGLLWSPRVVELVRENLEFALATASRADVSAPEGARRERQAAPSAPTQRATSSSSE